jgi:hypothetical protein
VSLILSAKGSSTVVVEWSVESTTFEPFEPAAPPLLRMIRHDWQPFVLKDEIAAAWVDAVFHSQKVSSQLPVTCIPRRSDKPTT